MIIINSFRNGDSHDDIISAPQQLGLMGMEALETVIAYWEDALAAYNPTARHTESIIQKPQITFFML